MSRINAALTGSCAAGLIASLCCGGSLVFASIGLGAFWAAFGLSRYLPQVLATGALSIIAINYFFYRRAAARISSAGRSAPCVLLDENASAQGFLREGGHSDQYFHVFEVLLKRQGCRRICSVRNFMSCC
jgi:hypothetical protein